MSRNIPDYKRKNKEMQEGINGPQVLGQNDKFDGVPIGHGRGWN